MKVLIAGAGGQVGGALFRTSPPNNDVIAMDRASLDLANAQTLSRVIAEVSPDLILNAAAYTAVDRAESDEGVARSVNSDAVAVMAQSSAKLVHISTDFVFDGSASEPYQTDAARAPLSIYGRTKSEGEDHLRSTDLLVRTSWVYEAGGTNFVRTMLKLMRERDEINVVADQIGSPTWASGLAETIWSLIEKGASGTFHHTDDAAISWYDFAVAIAEEAREIGLISTLPTIRPISTSEYPTPATRPAYSVLDTTRTRQKLGREAVQWRVNLRRMLQEERTLV